MSEFDRQKWNKFASFVHEEVQTLRVMRRMSSLMTGRDYNPVNTKKIEIVKRLRAAEFYPDENPPHLEIAESENELHAVLRERHPSRMPRLSGDVLEMGPSNSKFFTLNSVDKNTQLLMTEAHLDEVVKLLLSLGYVALDAEMNWL